MTTPGKPEYERHQPVWKATDDPFEDGHVVAGCTACGWANPPEHNSVRTFGNHLTDLGAPDYIGTYWKDWARYVEAPTGTLSRDQVARELFDYGVVMEEASKVYSELAGLSKPNTAACHVIDGAQRQYDETQADLILHDLLPLMDSDEARQAVIDYANNLHDGAYEEFQQAQARRAEVPA